MLEAPSRFCPRAERCSKECIKQRLGLLQIGRVKALGKTTVDRCQKVVRFSSLVSLGPETGKRTRRPQFQRLRTSFSSRRDSLLEAAPRRGPLARIDGQQELAMQPYDLDLYGVGTAGLA